jgi:acetyltransferase-like isoleucine patch superfamily enzyme
MSYVMALIGRFVDKALREWSRQQHYRSSNIKIAKSAEVSLSAKLNCDKSGLIEIGENCLINELCSFTAHCSTIKIGNGVLVGPETVIHTLNHRFERSDLPIWTQGVQTKSIIVEDDVWIGAHCTIINGVRIGAHSIIGAHSLVNKDIPPYSIAHGVPCKVYKSRADNNTTNQHT